MTEVRGPRSRNGSMLDYHAYTVVYRSFRLCETRGACWLLLILLLDARGALF